MIFEEADLVIKDCKILPMNNAGIIPKGVIAVKGGKISYVGDSGNAQCIRAEKVLEGHRKVAMPGLVNCHTHLAMTLFRGLAEDMTMDQWLEETIWPLEAKLRPEDVYIGSLLGCLEMIKNGVTCFADMYFFESKVAEAVKKAGIRASLASGIIETVDWQTGDKSFDDAVYFAQKYEGWAEGRITTRLGPHTAYTCTEETLGKIREKASQAGIGIHIHLSELGTTPPYIARKSNLSEVELLENQGFLDDDVLAAHCIHLTTKDITILAKRGVKVAYNPVSNMKLAQGVSRVKELIDAGITVGLGTDGAASNNSLDMFETMKIAALLQKLHYRDPTILRAREVLRAATIKGAEALGLHNKIGTLEVGKRADIILVDLNRPNLVPLHDIYANLVYSARGCDVDSVIVDGKILMENREVKTLNEEEVIKKAENQALGLAGS
ncbi:amidohydrolase [Candidatus Bathyarchaeota archaeon]|nr:MAG: amidohydrolase [Candidatus Bathyarchaeota archaeon]